MCTEFWIGWFDAWHDEVHHEGDTETAVKELENILELGNANIYMFEGGTDFSFYERIKLQRSSDGTTSLFIIKQHYLKRSTDKYRRFQKVISRFNKEEPLIVRKNLPPKGSLMVPVPLPRRWIYSMCWIVCLNR